MFGLSLLTSEENDGAIPRCSSHLGLVLRDDYKMNHIDMVNGVLGLHAGGDNNPVTLYRQQANRLKNLAL
ncbi:hypothetical protein [Veronia nyctiphanis]|nr:hypothetical protein [Veronia nyctiphanis]